MKRVTPIKQRYQTMNKEEKRYILSYWGFVDGIWNCVEEVVSESRVLMLPKNIYLDTVCLREFVND